MIEWLKQQPGPSGDHETAETSALKLLETINANHINAPMVFEMMFSVSQLSSSIAVTSPYEKPSLSVMYPGTNKPPLILSNDGHYTSPVFVIISNKEYLAAASKDVIHLWNLDRNKSSIVYKLSEINNWHLCVIDKRTVACVGKETASDGFNKIYLLNTDSEQFTLSGTLRVKAELSGTLRARASEEITNMCYMKTADSTPCVLLSFTFRGLLQCVEMVGGKVRWRFGKQQIGEQFLPWSVCTDGSTIFVADIAQSRLHLLSVEDGSVLTSIYLLPLGIVYPGCVRLQGEHLYVGHPKTGTYCISKFTKPVEV